MFRAVDDDNVYRKRLKLRNCCKRFLYFCQYFICCCDIYKCDLVPKLQDVVIKFKHIFEILNNLYQDLYCSFSLRSVL